VIFGIGQGSLVTLVFNVLVTDSTKELARDVGSLRGTTQNLAAAVGTAVAGALLVGLLSDAIMATIAANPKLTPELQSQVDLDNVNFISNDRLQTVLEGTTASPAQVAETVRVNTESRLRALKIGLLIMAGIAMLAIFPAGWLPHYIPGEVRDPLPKRREKGGKSTAEVLREMPGLSDPLGGSALDRFHDAGVVAAGFSQRTRIYSSSAMLFLAKAGQAFHSAGRPWLSQSARVD
jgi:hypothetical protein